MGLERRDAVVTAAQGQSAGPQEKERGARPPYVVFISHSSRDRWVASVMAEKVEARGARAWLDVKSLMGGEVVVSEILKALDACDEAVILVTPAIAQSQWIVFELGVVRGLRKHVTPVFYHTDPQGLAPASDLKSLDLNEFDVFLHGLERRIVETGE